MESRLTLDILPQPDDATCGPTALHAVYRYYNDDLPLGRIIEEIVPLETGGTLAVHLACHALKRGYRATIYTYNLHLFDPTWFDPPGVELETRLRGQAEAKADPKLRQATEAYLEFLSLGGELRFQELSPNLIRRYLKKNAPLLTGLSATYLYGCSREVGTDRLHYDDVRGYPTGHFVILCGYDADTRQVLVADPLQNNPRFDTHYYEVGVQRVLGAVLLGVLTYDANFLVLRPSNENTNR